jgi:hypothetical protein
MNKAYQETLDSISTSIKECEANLETLQQLIQKVESDTILLTIPHPYSWASYNQSIDFDYPDREATLAIIKAFGGKWDKVVNGDKVNYSTTTSNGLRIRIYGGTPPPSCKIIEVEEYVPAVPATTRTVRILQCVEPVDGPVSI